MGRLPLLCQGQATGEAVMEQESLYTCLRVHAPSRPGLWCAWAVGERGEVRVGVLEPVGGSAGISRRFSRQSLAPAGTLLRVELRPVGAAEEPWKQAGQTTRLLRGVRFRRQLQEVRESLTRMEGERRCFALPWKEGDPFPVPELFCLAHPRHIGARDYWVFAFDPNGWPVL